MTAVGTFPYRFVATEGMYEGTTFVYLASGVVVSYDTDSPTRYFWTPPTARLSGTGPILFPTSHQMTPEKFAEFEAVPLRGTETS